MTFSEGILKLMGRAAPFASTAPLAAAEPLPEAEPEREAEPLLEAAGAPLILVAPSVEEAEAMALELPEPSDGRPGIRDIEAAVRLVESGLASRVLLTGFSPWRGLLWRAQEIGRASDVLILPTVAASEGVVDLVVMRDPEPDPADE